MLPEGRKFSLGRQGIEWLDDDLTVAHQIEYFNVLVSAFYPESVGLDFIKIFNPFLQSYLQVSISLPEERTLFDLLSQNSILNLFGGRQFLNIFRMGLVDNWVPRSDVVFEVGDCVDSTVHPLLTKIIIALSISNIISICHQSNSSRLLYVWREDCWLLDDWGFDVPDYSLMTPLCPLSRLA